MRQTGGRAVGATSTRSRPASRLSRKASAVGTMPTCSSLSLISRTGEMRIPSFLRKWVEMACYSSDNTATSPGTPHVQVDPEYSSRNQEIRKTKLQTDPRRGGRGTRPTPMADNNMCIGRRDCKELSQKSEIPRSLAPFSSRGRPRADGPVTDRPSLMHGCAPTAPGPPESESKPHQNAPTKFPPRGCDCKPIPERELRRMSPRRFGPEDGREPGKANR